MGGCGEGGLDFKAMETKVPPISIIMATVGLAWLMRFISIKVVWFCIYLLVSMILLNLIFTNMKKVVKENEYRVAPILILIIVILSIIMNIFLILSARDESDQLTQLIITFGSIFLEMFAWAISAIRIRVEREFFEYYEIGGTKKIYFSLIKKVIVNEGAHGSCIKVYVSRGKNVSIPLIFRNSQSLENDIITLSENAIIERKP